MNAAETLCWIEAHSTQVIIQSLPKCRRAKNRIILGYRDAAGTLQACGGRSIIDAASKAADRMARSEIAGNGVPKPHLSETPLSAVSKALYPATYSDHPQSDFGTAQQAASLIAPTSRRLRRSFTKTSPRPPEVEMPRNRAETRYNADRRQRNETTTMKRLFLFFLLVGAAMAQQYGVPASGTPIQTVIVTTDPSGSCTNYNTQYYNPLTGHQWACVNSAPDQFLAGSWTANGGSNYTFSAPLALSGSTVSLPQANGSASGYLSASDWTAFNSKQPAGNYLVNPLTTAGDLIYQGSGGPARLAIGANGYCMEVVSGLPSWQPCGGFTGTANSIPFVGPDGKLTEDNPNWNYDDTNHKLTVARNIVVTGSNPFVTLDTSNAGTGYSAFEIYNAAGEGGAWYMATDFYNKSYFGIGSDGNQDLNHFVLNSNGNVYLAGGTVTHTGSGATVSILASENGHIYTHGTSPGVTTCTLGFGNDHAGEATMSAAGTCTLTWNTPYSDNYAPNIVVTPASAYTSISETSSALTVTVSAAASIYYTITGVN